MTGESQDGLRIGELARRTGVSPRSLRYYEQRGLITAQRDHLGHRHYSPDVIAVVANIRQLLAAGLTTDDIAQFGTCLAVPDLPTVPCADAVRVHEHRLRVVEGRIAALDHLRSTLAERVREWRRGPAGTD